MRLKADVLAARRALYGLATDTENAPEVWTAHMTIELCRTIDDAAERIERALSPFVDMAEALAELQRKHGVEDVR